MLIINYLNNIKKKIMFNPPLYLETKIESSIKRYLRQEFPVFTPKPVLYGDNHIFLFSTALYSFS